jgi:NAD(P)-dependent dehydrogenase (short-subunit alcohol dehydrogenase family)
MKPASPEDGIAWVTGASGGIGLAVALRLVRDGWTVAVTARRGEELEKLAVAHPGKIIAAPADVTDAAAVTAAVAKAEGESGRAVALAILNAGTYAATSAQDFNLDKWKLQIETNLNGAATTLEAVMPAMIARGAGQIAIVASVAGYRGLPMAVGYGATKAALINMAECLRFDLERVGVLMQVINPGFVKTPLTDKNEFPMPFLVGADDAADRIVRGLGTTRFEIAFPWQLVYILKFVRLLPYALFFPLVGRATKGRK